MEVNFCSFVEMGKKKKEKSKEEELEEMLSLPYGCAVTLPGIKCAFRGHTCFDVKRHVDSHLENTKHLREPVLSDTKNVRRNKSRSYEVPIEWPNCKIETVPRKKRAKKHTSARKSDPLHAAIFGPDGQCVYVERNLFFDKIEERFSDNLISFDATNEAEDLPAAIVNQAVNRSSSSSSITSPVQFGIHEYATEEPLEIWHNSIGNTERVNEISEEYTTIDEQQNATQANQVLAPPSTLMQQNILDSGK